MSTRQIPARAIATMVDYEAKHQGEFGFYRIVFTALIEADDPEIRNTITAMYRQFHKRIQSLIATYQEPDPKEPSLPADATAWAMIGLATVSNIIRELDLLPPRQREKIFARTATYLIQGDPQIQESVGGHGCFGERKSSPRFPTVVCRSYCKKTAIPWQ